MHTAPREVKTTQLWLEVVRRSSKALWDGSNALSGSRFVVSRIVVKRLETTRENFLYSSAHAVPLQQQRTTEMAMVDDDLYLEQSDFEDIDTLQFYDDEFVLLEEVL